MYWRGAYRFIISPGHILAEKRKESPFKFWFVSTAVKAALRFQFWKISKRNVKHNSFILVVKHFKRSLVQNLSRLNASLFLDKAERFEIYIYIYIEGLHARYSFSAIQLSLFSPSCNMKWLMPTYRLRCERRRSFCYYRSFRTSESSYFNQSDINANGLSSLL